jgi:RecA-family ATPase
MDIKARLVVIDTAATCFSGNESDRGQVTQFVGTALARLAQDIDGAVLLNAHPSLSGLANGDLRSGSRAWNNSCRSRWGLTRPEDAEGKPILDSPERILTTRKANAASTGDTLTMGWRDGVFTVPENFSTAGTGHRKDQAEAAFLAALEANIRSGLHVNQNSRAGNYAPKVLCNIMIGDKPMPPATPARSLKPPTRTPRRTRMTTNTKDKEIPITDKPELERLLQRLETIQSSIHCVG